MHIEYTDHACRKAFLHGIEKQEVDVAIHLGVATPGRNNKLVFTDWNSRVVVVAAKVDANTYVAITTYRNLLDNVNAHIA